MPRHRPSDDPAASPGADANDRDTFARARRAQSEVTGTMLMVGVVAIAVTVAGGALLAGYFDGAGGGPSVDLDASANATHVTLVHAGGRGLSPGDVTVVLRADGSESRSRLADWTRRPGGDAFAPADRATTTHGFGTGHLEVVVVHRPTERVLLDETVPVGVTTTTTTVAPTSTATTTTTTAPGPTPEPTATVGPPNQPPSASFTSRCRRLTCAFDAGGSADPDGTVVSYRWRFDDGTTASGETVTHTFASSGRKSVGLTVTDDDGATDTVVRRVVVETGPHNESSVTGPTGPDLAPVPSARAAVARRPGSTAVVPSIDKSI